MFLGRKQKVSSNYVIVKQAYNQQFSGILFAKSKEKRGFSVWLAVRKINHSLSYLSNNLQVKSVSVGLEEKRQKFVRKVLAVSHPGRTQGLFVCPDTY